MCVVRRKEKTTGRSWLLWRLTQRGRHDEDPTPRGVAILADAGLQDQSARAVCLVEHIRAG